MRKHFLKYGNYQGVDITISEFTNCIDILKRLEEDDFESVAHEYLDEKYGKATFKFNPIKDSDSVELIIERPYLGPNNEEEFSYDMKKQLERADNLRLADLDKLFKIMKEKIDTWWN